MLAKKRPRLALSQPGWFGNLPAPRFVNGRPALRGPRQISHHRFDAMFFPDRIQSICPGDRVLEVGPGGTPHRRADVFLEKEFATEHAAQGQRGYAPPLDTERPVVFYDGGRFPFRDGEFDYVICSHVIEHVGDVDQFVSELCRVAERGYLEFPTIYYEYLYDFPEHTNCVLLRNNILWWMPKQETSTLR